MGIIRATLFIVGTCIGAGFVSGAELVRFFGAGGFFLPVIVSSLAFYFLLVFALLLGKKYGGYESATNTLFKRFAPAVRILIALFSFIPCAGFIAGFDALLPNYKPLLSIVGLLSVSLFVGRGMKGVGILNAVLVPALIAFLFVFGDCAVAFRALMPVSAAGFWGGVVYAGMNAFLALPVLMDAGREMKRPCFSAALAACFIGACALFVLGAVAREGQGAIESEMPFLFVMRGNVLFYVAAALAIATSLCSSLYPLFSLCERLAEKKKAAKYAARALVLLAAFAFSRLGLAGIVVYFYPILGIIGLFFSVFCVLHEYLFEEHDEEIHACRKKTKQKRRAHHKVELKHLPAVDDKITKPRL